MTTLAPLLLLAAIGPAAADPPDAGPPLAPAVADLQSRFEARERAFDDELAAANALDGEAYRKKIADENEAFQRDWFAMADQLRALIRSRPADPAALDGMILLAGPMRSFLDEDLVRIVRDRFLDDPRLGRLCSLLAHREEAMDLLGDVADDHPDRAVRGQAAYALARCCRYAAEQMAGDEPARAAAVKLTDRAKHRFRQVIDEFGDVRSAEGDFLLSERAEGELARFQNLPDLKVGRPAPEIVGEALDGRPLRLSDHRGKVVVLVFWATWCGPCMAMVPHERELAARLAGEPFALLGVNSDDPGDREKACATAAEKGMAWPSWWDGGLRGRIQTSYDVQVWPTVYVLDPKGVIRHIGPRGEALDGAVDALLAEMKVPAAP